MLKSIINFFKAKDIAIDLGTANTLVYVKGKGVLLNEPSVVAQLHESGEMAFGYKAKLMLGKTPGKIDARRPLKDGVIADFKFAEEMIKHYVRHINPHRTINNPMIIICVPSGATPVDRRAIQDAAENGGGNPVYLIEETMAAAIGAKLPVSEPSGSMIIDIGGGTTEIGVLSLGGIVYSSSIRIGGDKMDESIINYIRKKHNLLIGESTAEKVKIKIGNVGLNTDADGTETPREIMEIKGRDLLKGIPKAISLSKSDISVALEEPVKQIVEASKLALEHMPPELASDIVDKGICLTGGGALIKNLDRALAKETGLKITIAKNPLLCVVLGTGMALENPEQYRHVLFRQD